MQRRFLGLVAVRDETCQEVDQKIERAAVAGMRDLADILEFAVDALDVRAFAQQ